MTPRPLFRRLNRISRRSSAPRHHPTRIQCDASLSPGRPPLAPSLVPAAQAASPTSHHRQSAQPLPPRELGLLDHVLKAIQCKDHGRILEALLTWTNVLRDPSSPRHEAVLRQAQQLPGPTFSEILRSLDPTLSPLHDVAHGLNITLGQTQYIDVGKLVDEFGVRKHHRTVLYCMHVLLDVRRQSRLGLTPADHEVLLRYAGAAVARSSAKKFWAIMAVDGIQRSRTAKTWNEFLKARFLTEPVYYQFDRARVALLARDQQSNTMPLPLSSLVPMDRIRFSINASKRLPWNRQRNEPSEDLRRNLRRRRDRQAFMSHWVRGLCYGLKMDEELLCTSMIAFSRSGSRRAIKNLILKFHYGIDIVEAPLAQDIQISRGFNFAANSPLKPTTRLLNAVADAFGCMSCLPLATKLIQFLSQRYDIPILHETWSRLLSWTYVCASKPFRQMRKLRQQWLMPTPHATEVHQLWQAMTSEPFNIKPAFEDCSVYIKTLIRLRSFDLALGVIREHVLPYYNGVVREYENAVLDEILRNDLLSSPRATLRRRRAEVHKDYVRHHISFWLDRILKVASAYKLHREGPVMHVLVPNLIHEFGDLFHHQIRYRTAQGVVQFDRPQATHRFKWFRHWRDSLPAKISGIYLDDFDKTKNPRYPYPNIPNMKILQWERWPKSRRAGLGRAPGPTDAGKAAWWRKLERELLL